MRTCQKRRQLDGGFPRSVLTSAGGCRRFLHPLAVHAISGAVGEVCQVATTYPLSTIAVSFVSF